MVNQHPETTCLTLSTAHFGAVVMTARDVLHFTSPLPPFFTARRFVLLGAEEEAPFLWLQSVDEPALALVVAPYEVVCGAAAPPLTLAVARELGYLAGGSLEAYVIIAVGATPAETTMNALAPVYVCRDTNLARQVVLEGDIGLTRTPVVGHATAA